ncbi:MAG: Swt1 family HEPN domain-containing protein [Treponema sp.]|nr:Swt1 family HEPN domain-containing protein [Treponema sp.]
MEKTIIDQYIVLYRYILMLKEPLYVYLIQIFQRLSPKTWWNDFIYPVIYKSEYDKENFKYLDMADLLNIYKANWERIFQYLDKKYYKFKYNKEFLIVDKFHQIRNIIAHANENNMTSILFVEYLSDILKFCEIIKVENKLVNEIKNELKNCKNILPLKISENKSKILMDKIITKIEKEVLLEAIHCTALSPATRISINRTTMRFRSMRTIEEVMGFFNNAIDKSEYGKKIKEELVKNGLTPFEGIKDEINKMYNDGINV